jgi:hypothetical protein
MELITLISIYWIVCGAFAVIWQYFFEDTSIGLESSLVYGGLIVPQFIISYICNQYSNWKMRRLKKSLLKDTLELKKILSEEDEESIDFSKMCDSLGAIMDRLPNDPMLREMRQKLQEIRVSENSEDNAETTKVNKSLDK